MVVPAAVSESDTAPNHPAAVWMALIASISHNMIVGCLMGSFSVMREPASKILGVSDAMVSLAGPLILVGSALAGAVVGDLMVRISLKRLMLAASVLALAGYLILAFNTSFAIYIAVYALCFGPGMAICGSVGPATLVTRWFSQNRGLALGLVHVNLIVAAMPLLCVWLLGAQGPKAVYLMMAALIGLTLIPALLFVRDYPPGAEPQAAGAGVKTPTHAAQTVGQLARSGVYWRIALPFAMVTTAVMVLTFTMVQIVMSFGYTSGQGAGLQAVMSFAGMAGSILFGWVADKLGGIRGMALLAVDFAIIMVLLMFKMPFEALTAVMALAGLHGAGMVPNTSRAFADQLGAANFSRAFGLAGSVSLPVTTLAIVGMSMVHTRTGSYTLGLGVMAALLLLMAPVVLSAGKVNSAR